MRAKKVGDNMLMFFLGMLFGGNVVLMLYACIIAGKESEQKGKDFPK